jgi:ribosomal protein S18 acetylase RimI-like enzyme
MAVTKDTRLNVRMREVDDRLIREAAAVSKLHQGRGCGKELLRHAISGAIASAENLGMRSMLVHALDENAASFYRSHGFEPSPTSEFTLLLHLHDARRTLS